MATLHGAIGLVALLASNAQAQVVFDPLAGTTNMWNSDSNWEGGYKPCPGETVSLPTNPSVSTGPPQPYYVTVGSNATAAMVTFSPNTFIRFTPPAAGEGFRGINLIHSLDSECLLGRSTTAVPVTDENGNVVPVTDENGNVVPVTGENGNVVPVTDENGNVVPVTDDNGNTIDPSNNPAGVPVTGPNGMPVFDAFGNMLTYIPTTTSTTGAPQESNAEADSSNSLIMIIMAVVICLLICVVVAVVLYKRSNSNGDEKTRAVQQFENPMYEQVDAEQDVTYAAFDEPDGANATAGYTTMNSSAKDTTSGYDDIPKAPGGDGYLDVGANGDELYDSVDEEVNNGEIYDEVDEQVNNDEVYDEVDEQVNNDEVYDEVENASGVDGFDDLDL